MWCGQADNYRHPNKKPSKNIVDYSGEFNYNTVFDNNANIRKYFKTDNEIQDIITVSEDIIKECKNIENDLIKKL